MWKQNIWDQERGLQPSVLAVGSQMSAMGWEPGVRVGRAGSREAL